jgi:hypothetical protein
MAFFRFGPGFGFARSANGSGGAVVVFSDTFSGTASDPSLDATLWTQKTRTGTSDVNTTVAGKAVCRRFSGALSGRFTAYGAAIVENDATNTYTIGGLLFGMVDGLNLASLLFRHTTKDQTDYDGSGLGAGDKGYRLDLIPAGVGAAGQLYRSDNGAYAAVGAAFTCTGLDATTPADVVVTATTMADRIRVVVKINGSTVATIDDTDAGRLVLGGYSGFSHFASQALGGAAVDMTSFQITT